MTSDTALPVELDENGIEAAMVWFARNFNGVPDGRALTTGIVTAYLRALSATRTGSASAELLERLSRRAKEDRQCEENNTVVADCFSEQMQLFETREGHNVYAVRMAIDHRQSAKRDAAYAEDLEAAISILSPALSTTEGE